MTDLEMISNRMHEGLLSIEDMTKLKDLADHYIQKFTNEKVVKVVMEKLRDGWEYDFNGLKFEAHLHAYQGKRFRVYRRVYKNGRLVKGEVVISEFVGSAYDIRKAIAFGKIK
jgi:hypothetical protein